MPSNRIGLARQVAFILADHDLSNAPTTGDIAEALGLRTGTVIGERIREARTRYGFAIRCLRDKSGDVTRFRYLMPARQRESVKRREDYQRWRKSRRAA